MLYLSQSEIDDLCAPLQQPAAQVRYLRALGLTVNTKPNGRPVVIRSHAEMVLSGRRGEAAAPDGRQPAPDSHQPNRAALISLFSAGRKHGAPPEVQPA